VSYVNVQYAADQLGCTVACLFRDAPKYRPFLRKSSDGKHNAGFNLEAYINSQELRTQLIERTRLMSEYLHHIEGVTYTDMGKLAGVTIQQIAMCTYGYDVALALARAVKKELPYEWERFHKYYGWSHK